MLERLIASNIPDIIKEMEQKCLIIIPSQDLEIILSGKLRLPGEPEKSSHF